jgi:hypothetical protein
MCYNQVVKTARCNKVRLYVPSKDRHGKRVSNRKVVTEAENLFAQLFGGCTCLDARGTYISEGDILIRERINIVESSCADDDLVKHLPTVRAFAEQMKLKLNQEAVALEINNVLEFI